MTLLWPFDCNLYLKLFDNRYACNTLCTYYDIWCQLCFYFCSFSVFSFSFSIFANSLPRSQLIEQSSWQMFNWAPFSGSLAPSWSSLSVPARLPSRTQLKPCSAPSRHPLKIPHSSASLSFIVCSYLAAPSWHPIDTLSFHSPLSLASSLLNPTHNNGCSKSVSKGNLDSYVQLKLEFFATLPSLSLTVVYFFFFLFSVALCLLCCWQTVYYFVDKCVFELDSPREGAGEEGELN